MHLLILQFNDEWLPDPEEAGLQHWRVQNARVGQQQRSSQLPVVQEDVDCVAKRLRLSKIFEQLGEGVLGCQFFRADWPNPIQSEGWDNTVGSEGGGTAILHRSAGLFGGGHEVASQSEDNEEPGSEWNS